MWILVTVIALVVLAFFIGIFGQVRGEEFSPQKFTIRGFSYVQIPFLRIQIWPVKFAKVRQEDDKLAKHIRKNTRQNKLMKKIQRAPVRWDIMNLQEAGNNSYRGDATILTNYLRQRGAAGMESWFDWTTANPKLAEELWSRVAQLAHHELYVIIPDVLEAARRTDASNFKNRIGQIIARECKGLAKAHQEAGDTKRANEIAAFSQQFNSEDAPTTSGNEI